MQLYLRDVVSSVATPDRELKAFRRIRLEPGEKREVSFTLGPRELRLLNKDMVWVGEPGAFTVLVGPGSDRIALTADFVVV